MNMKALMGLVVIIIIGVGVYLLFGKQGGGAPVTITPQPGQSAMSIGSLVAAGQPVTCTFSTTTASGSTNGTVYVSGGMVRGDFTTTDPRAGTIDAHMIVESNTSYVWTSASAQGFKSTINANQTTSSTSGGVGYNAQMNYSCQTWTPDSSKFNLPANISFTATASYTPPVSPTQGAAGTSDTGTKGTAAQCAACNQLSGASKAQCLVALHC